MEQKGNYETNSSATSTNFPTLIVKLTSYAFLVALVQFQQLGDRGGVVRRKLQDARD